MGIEIVANLKELLRYGEILYEREFYLENARIRIIKYDNTLFYTEQTTIREIVISLDILKKCTGLIKLEGEIKNAIKI